VGGKLRLAAPKTKSSKRVLPLPAKVERALARHAERQEQERQVWGADWNEQGLVFSSVAGMPIEPRNLVRHFKTLLRRADLPDIRFHDLRHSCATILISQGVHPRIVMEIMGHSQISVTMNRHGLVLPEAQREAARMLDQVYREV
jgi:integrase